MLKKMSVVLGVAVTALAVACGGGGGQSQACKDYLACYVKTGGTASTLDGTYGAMGSCWSVGGATATACTDTCKTQNDSYKTSGQAADAGCTFM